MEKSIKKNFFLNIKKVEKPLAVLMNKKGIRLKLLKTRNEREITTGLKEMKRIIRNTEMTISQQIR